MNSLKSSESESSLSTLGFGALGGGLGFLGGLGIADIFVGLPGVTARQQTALVGATVLGSALVGAVVAGGLHAVSTKQERGGWVEREQERRASLGRADRRGFA